MAEHQRGKLNINHKRKRERRNYHPRPFDVQQRDRMVYVSLGLVLVLVSIYMGVVLFYIFRVQPTSDIAIASNASLPQVQLFARDLSTSNETNSGIPTTNAQPNQPVCFKIPDMVLLILGVVFSILGLQCLAWSILIVVRKGGVSVLHGWHERGAVCRDH
jgi:hypothetical protein